MALTPRYNKLKEAGLCVLCACERDTQALTCSHCKHKNTTRKRLLQGRRRKQGKCPRCGLLAFEGSRLCREHLEKERADWRSRTPKLTREEIQQRIDKYQGIADGFRRKLEKLSEADK